ncbi:multidrug ABC transporter ATP-binding protein [Intrasporangium oryzae NRRL B-24470]|uniref:Fatty acid ABC transporter ATP-binding/permease protein n=1 Tax=Intrasporangium oryzae NRRL B-24470 TaxID=1386089 RepID=W9GID6_9MICO|nr:ABC transporter ATP-binding protein [Intrasporangium oryzae]EWT03649.1 multidrug ABC transporter ATP-binding protein [Intrasporangium oryzae NRRL B-24470]
MAEGVKTAEEKAAEARRGPVRRGGPPHMQIGQPGEKSLNFGPSAKRLLGRLRPHRARVILVVALSVVSVILTSVGPKILGRATDIIFAGFIGSKIPAGVTKEQAIAALRAQGKSTQADLLSNIDFIPGQGIDFEALRSVLLLVVALFVVASLLMWMQGWILQGVLQKTMYALREEVEAKLNRLPLPYFDKQPRGEILSRVTNDIDNVGMSLQQTLSQLLNALLTVVAVMVMMFWISWTLALIALVTIPVSIVVTSAIAKRSQKLFIQQWRNTGELNGIIEETFTGHGLVKVYGRQKETEANFRVKNDELFGASFGAQFISGIIMPTMMFIGNLNYVVIAVVGGLRVASGSMSLGDVQAFIQYSRQFTQPLTQVASMANVLQSGVASAERVFEVLDADEQEAETTSAVVIDDPHGKVAFEHVSFSYVPDQPLIEDLNLTVRPGQTVAIVGPTGAGKTTLVNLIMRFYELDAGRITLDGVDIRDLSRHGLRSHIGMVLQDTWLFGGTIRDNIAYGRPGATDEEVIEAARATYVDRFVHSLPDGYDTVLDDEASNISAGEKQLLTIARAFLSDPALLILDEATSSVDTRTELLVQHAMAALRSDRTSFVIAHRLSTIRDADLILVMENGRIVEQGTHAELLAAQGAYATLYAAQFAGAAADLDDAAGLAGPPSGIPAMAGAGAPGGGGGAAPAGTPSAPAPDAALPDDGQTR